MKPQANENKRGHFGNAFLNYFKTPSENDMADAESIKEPKKSFSGSIT